MSTVMPAPFNSWKLGAGTVLTQALDGSEVIEIGYGSDASADLGVTPDQLQKLLSSPYVVEGIYQLQFDVVNALPKYPGYYQFEVDFGLQELCSVEGWGKVTFTTVTVICPGPGYIVIDKALPGGGPVQGASNLVIHAKDTGWPVYFKNVSLTFTPQP